MNGRYTNEGKTIHIPTISFFSASNEIPNFTNPKEKILKPLYDRFELKVVTEYVEDRAARLKILKQKQAAPHLAQAPALPSPWKNWRPCRMMYARSISWTA